MQTRTTTVDQELFEFVVDHTPAQVYEYLDLDEAHVEEEKAAFLSSQSYVPRFSYERLNNLDTGDLSRALNKVRSHATFLGQRELVQEAYERFLRVKETEIAFLKAAQERDGTACQALSAWIYGDILEDDFLWLWNQAVARMQALPGAWQTYVPNWVRAYTPEGRRYSPARAVTHQTRQFVREEYGPLLDALPQKRVYNAEDIKLASEEFLSACSVSSWSVNIIDTGRTAIHTRPRARCIEIPNTRRLSRGQLANLLVHEIGVHVVRGQQGYASSLMLLGSGLDKYQRFEEGLAITLADSLKTRADLQHGAESYLALGLVKGLGGQECGFRELFEVLVPYALSRHRVREFSEKRLRDAQERAWKRCVRVFRGSDLRPGSCFMKDVIYRNGLYAVAKAQDKGWTCPEMLLGKFDPTDPFHQEVVEHVTPKI